MQISGIDTIQQFDRLKADWEAVYLADPNAHIFLSWAWLRGWFEATNHDWFVIATRPDSMSPYVGFFPLARHLRGGSRSGAVRELRVGGKPLAEYSGFICLPEYEDKAVTTFAAYVQKQVEWQMFSLQDMPDPRLDGLLDCFCRRRFNVRQVDRVSCPYILLPDKWEQYLKECLGKRARGDLRRAMRKVESLSGFRVTTVKAGSLEREIETVLMLWQLRWGPKSEYVLNMYRNLFRGCFDSNCLHITILWDSTTPIAARAGFVDQQKKIFCSMFLGWDNQFSRLSPGKALNAYCIRYAIENGFRIFDFTRGNEAYKFSFGAKERFCTSVEIERRSMRMFIRKRMKKLVSLRPRRNHSA